MSLVFKSLLANKGDAFIIQWDESNVIIVDGGVPSVYGRISSAIKGKTLRAVFITHVDYDHIGGVIHLMKNEELDIKDVAFYMNHPELASYYDGEDVAFHHGDTLLEILRNRNKKFLPAFDEITITPLGELQIEVISPTVKEINELHKNWNASQVIEDGRLNYLQRQKNNGDIINRSSIAMLLKYRKYQILLLGDSHPDLIFNAISKMGYSESKPILIDLYKVSHHGSKHNTELRLLKIVRCNKFYISSNGAGNYYHPDKELIQMIIDSCHFHNFEKVFIYTNYDLKNEIKEKFDTLPKELEIIRKMDIEFI